MSKYLYLLLIPLLFLLPLSNLIATETETQQEQETTDFFGSINDEIEQRPPSPLLTNIGGREKLSLNGDWNIIVDEHETGHLDAFYSPYFAPPVPTTGMELIEHSFDKRRMLRVPGDWNTQDSRLFRYRGVVWYQRNFNTRKVEGKRYFLHFDGVNYVAHVYLNGELLATHNGGYVAFNADATEALLDGDNYLVVRVDAKLDKSTVPAMKTSDFFKYGGITRDVHLVSVPDTFIGQYHIWLDDLKSKSIKAWVRLAGDDKAHKLVQVAIPEAGVKQAAKTNEVGLAEFSFKSDLTLWSPDSPTLYNVEIRSGKSNLVDHIGFRSIKTRGEQILLNGRPVFLRGISMHDESYLKTGVAFDKQDAHEQLMMIKNLNGNFVRLAHYPHNEHTLRTADELGLMVWSEIPIVSILDWENAKTFALAKGQLSDNLNRDLNRASIVMWSIANETAPQTEVRLNFLSRLADDVRSIDKSRRPIAAALQGDATKEFEAVIRRVLAEILNDPSIRDPLIREQLEKKAKNMIGDDLQTILNSNIEIMLKDKLGTIVDIIGYNEYFGWYYSPLIAKTLSIDEGTTRRTILKIMKDIRFRNVFGKPIVISEFGAGAKKGYESSKGKGMIWSEEYQATVYRHQVDMLNRNPVVQGMSPWVLKDFRSAWRSLNGIQETYNRKGVISEKGEKKMAFYVLQKFYSEKSRE